MVVVMLDELKDQDTTQAVVKGLVDRLETITAQIKEMQDQSKQKWEQLAAIGEVAQTWKESSNEKEQTTVWMGDATHRLIAESKPTLMERGNPFPKLEFPDFDGTNLKDWVYRSERYFEVEQMTELKKVRRALICMFGEALQWHYTFISNRGRADMTTWVEYVEALTKRFGKAAFDDPRERLKNLEQEEIRDNLYVYREEFEPCPWKVLERVELWEEFVGRSGRCHNKKGGNSRAERKEKKRRSEQEKDRDWRESKERNAMARRMELCPGYMTEGCFWKIYFVLLHPRLKKEDAALLSTRQVMELRVMLMQELQSRNSGKPKSDQSERGALFESGESSHKELLSVPLSSGPVSDIIETSPSGTANSDADPVAEAEKHLVQAGEIHVSGKPIDGEKQIDVNEVKYQRPCPDSSSQVVEDKNEDDGEDWLKENTLETAEVKGTATINIENDEDVSFSDFEDDDGDIPATYKKAACGSDSLTRDSRDWFQLGGSSDDSTKDFNAGGRKGAKTNQANNQDVDTKTIGSTLMTSIRYDDVTMQSQGIMDMFCALACHLTKYCEFLG